MKRRFISFSALAFILIVCMPVQASERTMEERLRTLEDIFGGWTVYGSIRFATFYEESDSDFVSDTDGVTRVNAAPAITGPDQEFTQWALANNSRLGVSVDRKDNFGGRVELALKNDASVSLRLAYGTYTYGDATFLFGQDYTPLSEWDYSNQAFYSDNNLAGWGIIDVTGKRIPQVKMKWHGLQVALVQNKDATTLNLPEDAAARTQNLIPHVEAKYRLDLGTFFADIFGGAGSYDVESSVRGIDKTVTSYAVGAGGGIKLDPAYAKAMVWMARNGRQMSLHQANAAGATFDLDTFSLIDDDDFGWALVTGVKLGKITVEAGYGFVSSEKDISGADKDEARNYYIQTQIPIAQNVLKTASLLIVPEAGVFDYMEDANGNDQGKVTYVGAKWQVNF